jgi:hypothetical protein
MIRPAPTVPRADIAAWYPHDVGCLYQRYDLPCILVHAAFAGIQQPVRAGQEGCSRRGKIGQSRVRARVHASFAIFNGRNSFSSPYPRQQKQKLMTRHPHGAKHVSRAQNTVRQTRSVGWTAHGRIVHHQSEERQPYNG